MAYFSVDVEVVQGDELLGQLMLVRCCILTEERQRRIAVAALAAVRVLQVAKNLVVGAVLLDDIDDVLDRGSST